MRLESARFQRLTAASRALSDETPLDALLAITADAARDLLGVECVALMVLNPVERLELRVARGISEASRVGFDLTLDEDVFVRLGAIVDPLGGTVPFMGAPLLARARVVGLLAVRLPKGGPGEGDDAILCALADQASAALEHDAVQSVLGGRLEESSVRERLLERALQVLQHDLRTPMGAVHGYVELLQRGAYGALAPRQRSALGRIGGAVTHLETLLEEAGDIGRLRHEDVAVACEPVPARRVVEEAMGIVALAARQSRVKLSLEVPEDLRVLADGGRLRQVLVNLLDNAIKHGGENGEVRVACASDGDGVAIRVSDGGPGVPGELAEEIFQPYKSYGDGAGSGLGLAIARGITQLMGGELRLDREASPGATFVARLPRA